MSTDAAEQAVRERLTAPGALLKAALWYARRGVLVFPCHPGEKTPATLHGFKDATTDEETIRAWWAVHPQANIGLPTGHRFDVIDVDPPDGWVSLAELRDADLVPATIGYVVTPRTGAHLYVTPGGHGNAAGMLPGIDWRGEGGYVVGPPSRNGVGTWAWAEPLDLPT